MHSRWVGLFTVTVLSLLTVMGPAAPRLGRPAPVASKVIVAWPAPVARQDTGEETGPDGQDTGPLELKFVLTAAIFVESQLMVNELPAFTLLGALKESIETILEFKLTCQSIATPEVTTLTRYAS